MGREKIIRTNRKPRANPIKPDPTDPSDKTHIPDASTSLSNPTIDDISGVPNPNPNFNKSCWGYSTEEELQELLLKNLEFIYTEAISKLVLFGIEEGLALKSILRNGHCYGTMDVLPNILHNALAYLNSIGSDCNWDSDKPEYGFASLRQLAEYSLDSMVRHLQKVRPQLTEGDAMWCLFKNNFHVGHASSMEMPALAPPSATIGETADSSASPGLSGFHGSWGLGGVEFPVNSSMYVSKMREIEYVPKGFQLSSSMKALLNQNVPAFAAVIRANSQAVLQSQARQRACSNSLPSNDLRVRVESGSGISSVQYEEPRDCQNSDMMSSVLDSLGNMSIDVKPDEAANQKSKMISNLENQMRELEGQLKERREWALKKAIQAARRLSNDSTELKMLKMEREETHRHKGKQTLGDSTMKRLSEMENALRTASGQVDRANAAVRRLDTENAEIKAEMEAAKLSAAESAAACSEAEKREKKYLKRLQVWENQEAKLQDEITEEKQKIAQLQRQLELVKEAQKETEIKWRQEQKAKVQAIAKVEEERRAKEAAEATVKRRQETLHREIERDFQRHKDDIQRLEQELSRLKASADSSQVDFPSNTSGKRDSEAPRVMNSKMMFHDLNKLQESSQKEVNHGRECLLCKKDEVSIVFLPCAHQVLCSGCNEEQKKAAKTSCPCCGIQIEQRIHVYGASS